MTTQNYWENIHDVFPQVKQQQFVKDLDKAQKLFATETGIITEQGELLNISTNFAWVLPTGFRRLLDVKLYDSSGNPVYWGGSEAQITYETELGKFYIKSLTSTPITATPSGINKIYLVYEKIPTTLSSVSTALEIEEDFRDALLHYVLKNYFALYPVEIMIGGQMGKSRDWSAVKFHQAEYERLRLKAKRYVNSKEKTLGDTWNFQHAGRQRLPLRSNDTAYSSTSITQVTALSEIYEKYALYHLTPADAVDVPEELTVGYTTINASKTGLTFTITSTAEFGTDTQLVANDGNVSWVRDSASQITVTLPLAYTLIALELWERI